MLDLWELFSQTGNIDTYLLLKELEKEQTTYETTSMNNNSQHVSSVDSAYHNKDG